jgi:hypothetical protein
MIKGGYILQPRIIQESDISVAPPYVREIWNYLLREANSKDIKYNGHEIKRGQLFRSYEDIREGTKWFIGWRKMTYNENQTKKAMKFLRDTRRIDTTKELGGVLITICKYDYYQDSKNYDRTTNDTMDRTIEEPMKNQPLPDNNKKEEEEKKKDKKKEFDFAPEKLLQKTISDNNLLLPDGFYEILLEWLKYKSERGQSYKPIGMKNLIKKFLLDTEGNLEMAQIILINSTGNNYAGLFKPNNYEKRNGRNGATVEQLKNLVADKFGTDSPVNILRQ